MKLKKKKKKKKKVYGVLLLLVCAIPLSTIKAVFIIKNNKINKYKILFIYFFNERPFFFLFSKYNL